MNLIKLSQLSIIIVLTVPFFGCTTNSKNKSQVNNYAFRCNANRLPENEGAIFIRGYQHESTSDNKSTPIVGVKFGIERINKEKSKLIDVQIDNKQWQEKSGAIVNFKPGNYRLRKITLMHQSGIQIEVPFQKPRERFQVHAKCISYIGDYLFNLEDKKIFMSHKMDSKSYDLARNQMQTDRSSILNGFNPDEFPEININDDEIGMHGDSIAKLKTSSMVRTFYIIDSNYGRDYAGQILSDIKKQEAGLSKCYSEKLSIKDKIKQTLLSFKFQVENKDQKLKNLSLSSSPKSIDLQTCVENIFSQIKVKETQYPEDLIISGRITWSLVKPEQTKQVPL